MLMTGRYPQRGGVNTWTQGNQQGPRGNNMALAEYTIAEHLKANGYKTALFGKWHLGADKDHGPTKQGFDVFWGHRGGFIDNYNHYFLHGNGFHDLYEGTEEVLDHRGKYFPDEMTRRAVEFIKANKDHPFFVYAAFNLPHYPEQADQKFDEQYKDMEMPRQSYAKVVSTVDDRMGWIVRTLEELKLRKNTIIVVMSDNGHSGEDYKIRGANHASGLPEGSNYGANGGGGNTGKWIGKKGDFHEGGIRVPAIISYPRKLPRGVQRGQLVTAMDWMPTLAALCGTELPAGLELDGHNIENILRSPDAKSAYQVVHWMWQKRWIVREGNWKLYGGRLLNLADEFPERKDYSKDEPEIARRLQTLHDQWITDVMPHGSAVSTSKPRTARTPKPAQPSRVAFDLSKTLSPDLENHGVVLSPADKAHSFDGENSYLELKRSRLPNPTGLGVSVSAELKASAGGGVIVAQGGQTHGYSLYLNAGRPCFALSGGQLLAAKNKLPDDWVTITAELRDDKTMSIAVNGDIVASGKAHALLSGFPGDGLQVGADTISPVGNYQANNHFRGMIRRVSVVCK